MCIRDRRNGQFRLKAAVVVAPVQYTGAVQTIDGVGVRIVHLDVWNGVIRDVVGGGQHGRWERFGENGGVLSAGDRRIQRFRRGLRVNDPIFQAVGHVGRIPWISVCGLAACGH